MERQRRQWAVAAACDCDLEGEVGMTLRRPLIAEGSRSEPAGAVFQECMYSVQYSLCSPLAFGCCCPLSQPSSVLCSPRADAWASLDRTSHSIDWQASSACLQLTERPIHLPVSPCRRDAMALQASLPLVSACLTHQPDQLPRRVRCGSSTTRSLSQRITLHVWSLDALRPSSEPRCTASACSTAPSTSERWSHAQPTAVPPLAVHPASSRLTMSGRLLGVF